MISKPEIKAVTMKLLEETLKTSLQRGRRQSCLIKNAESGD